VRDPPTAPQPTNLQDADGAAEEDAEHGEELPGVHGAVAVEVEELERCKQSKRG
jgi:hypothetical protein